MDFKDMIKEDIKKLEDTETVSRLQNKVIKDYKKLMDLNKSFSDKIVIGDSFKDEIYDFFISHGCVKSQTDHEGNTFFSPCTTYFKYSDNDTKGKEIYISVTFGDLNEYEKSITIIRHLTKLQHSLIYTFENSFDNLLSFKIAPTLNGDILFLDDCKQKVLECNSIEELSKLENQLKENIEDYESKLRKNYEVGGFYKLRDGQQFETFAEAFSKLK